MMPEWVADKAADSILAEMNEMQRLGKLSDEGLLMECLRSDAIDYTVVQEILNRWKPDWLRRDID